ncbi:antitoxin [Enterococcus faecalis]|nr:antitoxin [Enterococcus faecalis]TKP31000.1 antitoxin [Enterococcus faecalis]TKP35775.1 antitoxin [Enterococcus faecalis]TKP38542.1 antitoxin [Enterococcus faecalis]TKP44028.1 antitoxin [Enterococcus faecalis]
MFWKLCNRTFYSIYWSNHHIYNNIVLTKSLVFNTMLLQSANGGNKMSQSTITFRIPEDEKELVLEYAKAHNSSLTELYRKAVLDKIEDEIDLKTLRNAIEISKEKKEIGISQEEMENLLNEI